MLNRLFVYGIFLGEDMRKSYQMSNPQYATVLNYATFGGHIVEAYPQASEIGASLTGLVVELPKDYNWEPLDALEGGYDRVIITTTTGTMAYMYVGRK